MANTNWGNSESYLESQMEGVVEVSKSYNGGTTEDIVVNINNATDTITANLTEQSKKSIGSKVGLNVDSSTYIMTLQLLNKDGELLSEGTVDLPLESMVVNATYSNGIIKLTLKNGETLDVGISDLISGLVPDSRTINGKPLSSDITLTAEDVGASSPTNMVTTDTEQNITASKTFEKPIIVGTGTKGESLLQYIRGSSKQDIISISPSDGYAVLGNVTYTPRWLGQFIPDATKYSDIGRYDKLWKDLYLSGKISDGTNSISIAELIALKDAGGSAPENVVTTDTDQTITSNKNIASGKQLNFIGSSTYKKAITRSLVNGNIRDVISIAGDACIQLGDPNDPYINLRAKYFAPENSKKHDLGHTYAQWKDLYLSGNLSDGTNSIKIADIVALQTQVGNIDTLLTALNSGEGV